jgi:hypothetical protein
VRIGTWNLRRYPTSASEKAPDVMTFLEKQVADLWLFTEVNEAWPSTGGTLTVSPERRYGRPQDRWAGVWVRQPATAVRVPDEDEEGPVAAEEALCLTRITLPSGSPRPTLLVACSVLPWSGAGRDWPGLPSPRFDDQATFVLDHHLARIERARNGDEPIIWGGDFNQELRRPSAARSQAGHRLAGTVNGIARLQTAFDRLELRALSAPASEDAEAIDHLALSCSLLTAADLEVHRPQRRDGRPVSDHAAYLAHLPD